MASGGGIIMDGHVFPLLFPGATDQNRLRTIQGSETQLEDPHGITLDLKNKLIYVSNFGNAQVLPPVPGRKGREQ